MRKLPLLLPMLLLHVFALCQHSEATFQQLAKLKGIWVMQKGTMKIFESWTQLSAHEYAGKSWMVKNGDSVISETLILSFSNGVINYTRTVAGQNNGKSVSFTLTKATSNTYIFENPQHDFPKRIIYQFTSNDELTAFIDDGTDGGTKKSVFNYKRQKE